MTGLFHLSVGDSRKICAARSGLAQVLDASSQALLDGSRLLGWHGRCITGAHESNMGS
jgi:hypothetical protein